MWATGPALVVPARNMPQGAAAIEARDELDQGVTPEGRDIA